MGQLLRQVVWSVHLVILRLEDEVLRLEVAVTDIVLVVDVLNRPVRKIMPRRVIALPGSLKLHLYLLFVG